MNEPTQQEVSTALARIESQQPLLERVNGFCDEWISAVPDPTLRDNIIRCLLARPQGLSVPQLLLALGISPARLCAALDLLENQALVVGAWDTDQPQPRTRLYFLPLAYELENILGEGPNTSDTPIVSGGALKAAALTVLIEAAIAFIGWGIWRLL